MCTETTPAPSPAPSATRDPIGTGTHSFDDGCVARIHCTDVDELTEQIRDWKTEYAQLSPGSFAATGVMIPLDVLLVSIASFSGSLFHHGTPPPGCLSIVLRVPGSDRFLFRGRELLQDECVVLSAGADGQAVSHGTSLIATASVSEEVWRASSHWVSECSPPGDHGVRLRAPGTRWTAGVLQAIDWIANALARYPQAAKSHDIRASLADRMLVRLYASADVGALAGNDRHERAHQRLAVERARSFIHENLANPIRLSQLCSHAHAQARSLEYGFRNIVGMSPVSYIRVLRLNRAHRLLSMDPNQRTITEIALDCGFWHLSQFAMDYRKFFGESPSATRRRVCRSVESATEAVASVA